jgi:periplasmic protein TonB
MATITVLHAGLVALALWQRATPPAAEHREALITVLLMTPEVQQPRHAPNPKSVPLEAARVPILVPPEFAVNAPDDQPPPTPAVTVAAVEPTVPVAAEVAVAGTAPQWVTRVEYARRPVRCYPSAALRARLEGSAHLRVLVGEDGRPQQVQVSRSSGHALLDEAAIQCVRAARFKPYIHNGVPRAALVVVPIDFTLQRQG